MGGRGGRVRDGWRGRIRTAARNLSALVLLLDPSSVEAGAWTVEEGHTQLIFAATSGGATTRFDRRGVPRQAGRFSKQETGVAAERGLDDGLTLIAGMAGRITSLATPRHSATAWAGALSAGVRWRLWTDGASILSAQAMVAGGTERSGAGRQRPLGAPAEAELRLLAGHGFALAGMTAFAELQAGYRWRGGRNADELTLDATLGLRPWRPILLLLQSFNAMAVERERRFGGGRLRRHLLQPSLVWEFREGWSLQVGAFASLAGRETLQERGLIAALWRRF